ncbi:glycosyltransferase [Falsiroseomonas ponticola]|uniref:glycosyltransferase n=1 Tax=Falsiroseomonas ponticola TaxID=2786951 RepID=UPI0019329EAF|nr:glycosyltransferase [Roseomonas ponticola]
MQVLTADARPHSAFDETAALYDICFVLNVNSRGWILEKICRVIEQASGGVCAFVFAETNSRFNYPLPPARNYFFAHFALAATAFRKHPEAKSGNCFVWYTHPDLSKGVTKEELVSLADDCIAVFTPCSANKSTLVEWGAKGNNIFVPIGGADPAAFTPKVRDGKGAVGFVGAYYERKRPGAMLALARLMPEQPFLLIGPRAEDVENRELLWTNWPEFNEFTSLPNVRYVEASYDEFPRWYRECDVYCSVSTLEGGPIPAIEAMMSNIIPVLSDTGFARDIVAHGSTGYVFDIDAPPEAIVPLIQLALLDTTTDVATVAAAYSWDAFGREIWSRMRGDVPFRTDIALDNPASSIRYLRRGFHRPEPRGVWTRTQVAEMMIPLVARSQAKAVDIILWAPSEVGEDPIPVTFEVNGEVVAERLISPKPVKVALPVVNDQPVTDRTIVITIRCARLIEPANRPANAKERRSLGVKIGSFCVR